MLLEKINILYMASDPEWRLHCFFKQTMLLRIAASIQWVNREVADVKTSNIYI